jgi:hypothetical protein
VELVYAVDRRAELEHDAEGRDGAALREGVELVAQTRMSLSLNVSEELALEALAYRLQALLAPVTIYAPIGPRLGCRSKVSKAMNSEKRRFSGPWKSAEPVVSSPSSSQRLTTRRVCSSVWVM